MLSCSCDHFFLAQGCGVPAFGQPTAGNVAHALGVANEAFEELSDAAAVTSIEDTLVLQKEREQ